MIGSDAIAYERILLNTPSGPANTRWSDADLLSLTDRAVKHLVSRIYFPESRMTLTAPGNKQEFSLPEVHAIYRVYLNGQICVRTPGNIDTLEGRQIGYDDQTATGAIPSGGGGATGGTTMLPQWAVQTPTSYPYLNNWGAPSPLAQPFYPGQRPRYYIRGGSIGIVPAPAANVTITIDCVRVPSTLTATSQAIVVPDNFLEGIANFVVYRALGADKDPLSAQLAREAQADYEKQIRELRTWKRQYTLDDDQIMPLTYRGAYRFGGHRAGDDW